MIVLYINYIQKIPGCGLIHHDPCWSVLTLCESRRGAT